MPAGPFAIAACDRSGRPGGVGRRFGRRPRDTASRFEDDSPFAGHAHFADHGPRSPLPGAPTALHCPMTKPIALAALALLCACSGSPTQAEQIDEIEQQYERKKEAFEEQRRRFTETVDLETPLEYGELGQIQLREVDLVGWSGSALLRVDFTWVNTGPETRNAPRVVLQVMDPATGESQASVKSLSSTYGIRYATGTSYTAWIDVPTKGLHRRDGWTWEIGLVPYEEPGTGDDEGEDA